MNCLFDLPTDSPTLAIQNTQPKYRYDWIAQQAPWIGINGGHWRHQQYVKDGNNDEFVTNLAVVATDFSVGMEGTKPGHLKDSSRSDDVDLQNHNVL